MWRFLKILFNINNLYYVLEIAKLLLMLTAYIITILVYYYTNIFLGLLGSYHILGRFVRTVYAQNSL